MFIMQTGLTAEQVAAMPEERRMVYEAMPAWLTVAYAVGVFGGALGAFGLLVRKRWAVIAFGASLLAVVANMVGAGVGDLRGGRAAAGHPADRHRRVPVLVRAPRCGAGLDRLSSARGPGRRRRG